MFSAVYNFSRFESGKGLIPGMQDRSQRQSFTKDSLKVKEKRQARLTDSSSGIVKMWEKTVPELKRNGWLEAEVWMVEKPQERLYEKTQDWNGKPTYEVWQVVWHGTFHSFQKLD